MIPSLAQAAAPLRPQIIDLRSIISNSCPIDYVIRKAACWRQPVGSLPASGVHAFSQQATELLRVGPNWDDLNEFLLIHGEVLLERAFGPRFRQLEARHLSGRPHLIEEVLILIASED